MSLRIPAYGGLDRDLSLLKSAYKAANNSHDPVTKNGAVLYDPNSREIIVVGANRLPIGIRVNPQRLGPSKHDFMIHSEEGVIMQAAKQGVSTHGLHLFVCWAACLRCCRCIIEAGITRVVSHQDFADRHELSDPESRWPAEIKEADGLFNEAGVEHNYFKGRLGGGTVAVTAGQLWEP